MNNRWIFILGGSTGFGLATAKYMSSKGYNVFIVHRDRRGNLPPFEAETEKIRALGVQAETINENALTPEGQEIILAKARSIFGGNVKIGVFLHSIADGNLKTIFNHGSPGETLSQEDFLHTINAMGVSFAIWARLLHENGFLEEGSRIIGLTSEGGSKVMKNYAAVGAAKSVLETLSKYMAAELAKDKITVNLLSPGVSITPALRPFRNKEELVNSTLNRNPSGRLTLPEDVAKAVYMLSQPESAWITGEIIRVDGGEQLIA